MRFPYLIALCISIVLAGVAWYQSTSYICPIPITYTLGQLDDHFNLSREEALARIVEAEAVWESATGRELFEYDQNGSLMVNFVFDDRHAQTSEKGTLQAALDAKLAETKTLEATLATLQADYEQDTKDYQTDLAAHELTLTRHNERVTRYNDQGGAPPAIFADIERERQMLEARSRELSEDAVALNELADTINLLGQKSNELIEAYNKEVAAFNEQHGFSKEFTQGDYYKGTINIYTFTSPEELRTVLVHELGHALGIDHVADPTSVMYYLLQEDHASLTLSEHDLAAFAHVCGDGTQLSFTIRQFIREQITKIYGIIFQ